MSTLKFGTSGVRGLVSDLKGWPSYMYATAFINAVAMKIGTSKEILIGRDLRASSPEIANTIAAATLAAGFKPVNCGALPTPALALEAMRRGACAVMVTGSHIPEDRNGLKFYRADGEISKDDEINISAAVTGILPLQMPMKSCENFCADEELHVIGRYVERYVSFYPAGVLSGQRIAVYQQSSVARDLLVELITKLGGIAVPIGRSDKFIPMDTEAHRRDDICYIHDVMASGEFFALVTTDGDADRPLVADATGQILRGDELGLITAKYLHADAVVVPVTASSSIENLAKPYIVLRTKVGSPYVIAGIEQAKTGGAKTVVGFEANGGFLLGSDIALGSSSISALPTRDAMLPILSALAMSKTFGTSIGDLAKSLGMGAAASDRITDITATQSCNLIDNLSLADFRNNFFEPIGFPQDFNTYDGIKIKLDGRRTIHFRSSGNAPELRCYAEAESINDAKQLVEWGLKAAKAAIEKVRIPV